MSFSQIYPSRPLRKLGGIRGESDCGNSGSIRKMLWAMESGCWEEIEDVAGGILNCCALAIRNEIDRWG